MKLSTKDQMAGTFHELKGTVIEEAGAATNSPNLAGQGQAEKIAGKLQKKIGQIEEVVGS